jgi:hypothetical protein
LHYYLLMSVIYKRYFFFRILSLVIIIFLLQSQTSQAANRYWVFKNFYENDFSSSIKLSEWQLIEDDGTGSFSLSGHGTAILTMDDAAGGFANRLFSINGGSPRFVPFDGVNGQVELSVLSTTGGNQLFFLQAQEFDGSNNYLGQVNILAPAKYSWFLHDPFEYHYLGSRNRKHSLYHRRGEFLRNTGHGGIWVFQL